MTRVSEPIRQTINLSGLAHRLYAWDSDSDVTVLFLHGFLDVGLGWSFVVDQVREHGWQCMSLDWRGHGESEHIGHGGYYHFIDYIRDLEDCVDQLASRELYIVGHSMGAMALTLWLGTTSLPVSGVVLVEALGPMPTARDSGIPRVKNWLSQVRKPRQNRVFTEFEHVVERLVRLYPTVSPQRVRQIATWATVQTNEGFTWRYDRLHTTQSPLPISEGLAAAVWQKIETPMVWIGGEKSPWRGERLDWWLGLRPDLEIERLPNGGHMLQYEHPTELGLCITAFIERTRSK